MTSKGWLVITIILAAVLIGSAVYVFAWGGVAGTRVGGGGALTPKTSVQKQQGYKHTALPNSYGRWDNWEFGKWKQCFSKSMDGMYGDRYALFVQRICFD